jgi:hypothetical protein
MGFHRADHDELARKLESASKHDTFPGSFVAALLWTTVLGFLDGDSMGIY